MCGTVSLCGAVLRCAALCAVVRHCVLLRLASKAVREYRKELEFCFLRCHVTLKKNPVV